MPAPTMHRMKQILTMMAEHQYGMTVQEIMSATGTAQRTAYSYTAELQKRGLVTRDPLSSRYSVNPEALDRVNREMRQAVKCYTCGGTAKFKVSWRRGTPDIQSRHSCGLHLGVIVAELAEGGPVAVTLTERGD